jgi:hypothetical protein
MQVKARYDFEVFSGKELQQVLPAPRNYPIASASHNVSGIFDICSTRLGLGSVAWR